MPHRAGSRRASFRGNRSRPSTPAPSGVDVRDPAAGTFLHRAHVRLDALIDLSSSSTPAGTMRLGPPSGGAQDSRPPACRARIEEAHRAAPGSGRPFATASAQAMRYWPSAMFRLTACISSGVGAPRPWPRCHVRTRPTRRPARPPPPDCSALDYVVLVVGDAGCSASRSSWAAALASASSRCLRRRRGPQMNKPRPPPEGG